MRKKLVLLSLLFLYSGCAYYNAFYNAKKYYNEGIRLKKKGASGYKNAFRKSAEKCEKVIAWYPKSKWMDDAIYLLGVNLYEMEEYTKAEKKFRELLEYFPDSPFVPWSYLYLGRLYLKMERVSDAMFYLSMAKKKGGKELTKEALKEELKVYLNTGEHQKVIQLGNEYIKRFPSKKAEIMKIIGDAYLSSGDTTRALDFYRNTSVEEKSDSLLIKIGKIYLKKGVPDSTIKYTKDLKSPDAKLIRAKAFYMMSMPDSAINTVEDIARIRRDKYSLEANLLLSEIYQEKGDTTKMMKTLEKAKGLSIKDSLKEYALRKFNYYHDLEQAMKDSTFSDSVIAEDLFLYAEALYLYAGKPRKATQMFEKLEKDYPSSRLKYKSMFARAYLDLNILRDTIGAISILDSLSKLPDTLIYSKRAKEMLIDIQKGKKGKDSKKE